MKTEHRGFDFTKADRAADGLIRQYGALDAGINGEMVQRLVGTGIDVTEHEVLTKRCARVNGNSGKRWRSRRSS